MTGQAGLHMTGSRTIKTTVTERASIEIPFGGHDPGALQERQQRIIEDQLSVVIRMEDGVVRVCGSGEELGLADKLLRFILRPGTIMADGELKYYLRLLRQQPEFELAALVEETVRVSRQGKLVRARGRGQLAYLASIRSHDVVFGIGPAGTGKTYLAMAWAVSSLLAGEVARIILVRPVVEAGENLGFLPGDLTEKINPYLRPLHDAMLDMLGRDEYALFFEKGFIEVAPLAYMRGRTLGNSVIILDEAQNTTVAQMKMFLTRLGHDSKVIITGDATQTDLPPRITSGLVHARRILEGIRGIAFVDFTTADVVRHRLVQEIIEAYGRDQAGAEARKTEER